MEDIPVSLTLSPIIQVDSTVAIPRGPIKTAIAIVGGVYIWGAIYATTMEITAKDKGPIQAHGAGWDATIGILNVLFWPIALGIRHAMAYEMMSVSKDLLKDLDRDKHPLKDLKRCGTWDYIKHPLNCYGKTIVNDAIDRIGEVKGSVGGNVDVWRQTLEQYSGKTPCAS